MSIPILVDNTNGPCLHEFLLAVLHANSFNANVKSSTGKQDHLMNFQYTTHSCNKYGRSILACGKIAGGGGGISY